MNLFERQGHISKRSEMWEQIETLKHRSHGPAMFSQQLFLKNDLVVEALLSK